MAEGSSQRQKAVETNGEGDIDRISGLPDSVLLHILSFLPTKTCVCTMSLVSQRWRHLWEHLQVFDFFSEYCLDDYDIKEVKKFAFFVNTVLTLRKSRDILKMHLECGLIEEGQFSMIDFVDLWIHAAIGPRLEELHLLLDFHEDLFRVVLPHTLLINSSNLVSLSLRGPIYLNVQHSSSRIYFPSLKDLHLDVYFLDSIAALLTGCPILETLDIVYANYADAPQEFRFRVPPSMKRLKYSDNYCKFTSTYITIDAPCLEYLHITITRPFETATGNLHNVVEAYIAVSFPDDGESVNRLLNLLRAISGTKHLTLCFSTTKMLLCAPIPDFPVFRCLLHLNLQLVEFNSKLLAKVLENCHVLQDFVIEGALPLQIWEPQSSRIPNCLIYHLTSIYIKGHSEFQDELTFVEYILQNALVLKTMIIQPGFSLRLKEKHSILKKISNMPRGSNLCQVEFI